MRRFVRRLLALILTAAPFAGQAAVAEFSRWDDAGVTGLAYQFADADGRSHRLSFALPTADVDAALAGFARYDPRAVDDRARGALRRALEGEIAALRRRYPQAEITLDAANTVRFRVRSGLTAENVRVDQVALLRREVAKLQRDYPDIDFAVSERGRISARGPMDAAKKRTLDTRLKAATVKAERLAQTRQRNDARAVRSDQRALEREIEQAIAAAQRRAEAAARSAIADQNYAQHDARTVRPDYAGIARAGADDLAGALPAFQGLIQGLDRRAAINRLLAFFQSIPYDPLTSRSSGGDGAGFALPVALLARNRGDCDTKSVAFASVLHRLFPGAPIGLLLLDDHALIALDMPARDGDRTIAAYGRRWVLAEPVGPRLAKLGEIGEQTKRQLRNRPQLLQLF